MQRRTRAEAGTAAMRWFAALALCLALAALLGAGSAGADEIPGGGHAISGHVWRDAPGTPVAGAVLQACATTCSTTVSDVTGLYVFTGLADGLWRITVDPPDGSGLAAGMHEPVLLAGVSYFGQDVTLHEGATPPPTTTTTTTTTPTTTTTAAAAAQADVGVVLTSPFSGHAGEPVAFRATVRNAGPDAATGVVLQARIPADADLVSTTSSPAGTCIGSVCPIGTLAANATATVTLVLSPATDGPLTASVTVEADHDPDPADNSATSSTAVVTQTQPPPPPPPPVVPGTFNAVGAGTIMVNGVPKPADAVFALSTGDVVDVSDGVVTLTSVDGSYGSFSSASPTVRTTSAVGAPVATGDVPAAFKIGEAVGVTQLTLVGGDFSPCASGRSLSAKNQTPIRQLWGTAKGNFQTKGRYSAATVRGTVWLTQDRCDGTLTTVIKDTVVVDDSSLNKTVTVNEGQSYLALPPRKTSGVFKPPAVLRSSQTAATVRLHGLVWAGRTFATRASFERWLRARGATWQQFASAHRALAAALAARR